MKYLFFDIECANCFDSSGKISSFGYVLADEKYNVIEKKDILMNPDAPFDWYIVKHNMVHYPLTQFQQSPKFDHFYPEIKSLLEDKDTVVIGYAIDNDIKFLCDECRRYKLDYFHFAFYDAQKVFRAYNDIHDKKQGLSTAKEKLGLTDLDIMEQHKSADDAEMTMLVTKKMCDNLESSFLEIVTAVSGSRSEVTSFLNRLERKANDPRKNVTKGIKTVMLYRFMDVGKPDKGSKVIEAIKGKTFCFTKEIEFYQYYKAAYLLKKIINAGGRYTPNPTKCDIFVKVEGAKDKREETVQTMIGEGKKGEIIILGVLLKWLGISKDQLEKEAPLTDLSYLLTDAEKKQNYIK